MAKGLKIGDIVTVRKQQLVPKSEVAYHAGLTTIEPGQRGRIIEVTSGRGFIVEFDAHHVPLSTQSLELAPEPSPKPIKQGKKTRPKPPPVAPQAETQVETPNAHGENNKGMAITPNAAEPVLSEVTAPQLELSAQPTMLVNKEESLLDYLNQSDAGFVRLVANALLIAGNSPDVVLLRELRFIDLPEPVQQQVQALIRAKLALTPNDKSHNSSKPA